MTRVIIKFNDGSIVNLRADCIDIRDGWVMAWCGDNLVAIAKSDEVVACHVSEKKEDKQ